MSLDFQLQQQLDVRKVQSLYRMRRTASSPQGVELEVDGQHYLSFSSNDYLGLANHPQIIEAFQQGLSRWGTGSGAAHLVTGHSAAHHALEEELADFLGYPRVLLFSSGYQANLGVHQALLGRKDSTLHDRLNHASLLDGAKLSGAKLLRYGHTDVNALERRLSEVSSGRILVVTDGVFSMDGDIAPLSAIANECRCGGATLMVDDAHGMGVEGAEGRGTVSGFGLSPLEVPVLMGTLGKAFGVSGAFVAGSEALIETLIQQARTYIYTTATPPAQAEATRKALQLVREGEDRRQHLQQLIARFRSGATALGLNLMHSVTPIQPLLVGDSAAALQRSRQLQKSGILVAPMRPPTVPEGGARLRITLSANHTFEQVDRLLEALQ
ncbi:MAG: 8-amino-7-oxononanoate synthase [Gammaproteobacteria bacterium]|jgi:8-amino-7-oxononanoate synthase|nr:8-amino-7-oxononanoate synthase [Gammaproteobacteria bacterium]MBT3490165.1 8-amino-7-oxononanoate synthase [Gammaproteobacteria bacterium]MBT3718772.1 8-amino-7-oxononanoate synthase [Gammaproteobacteria bacterium]MBT3845735.1 8-amino-7-oxononanoate synthase [Gammaproteobacteria bacterium]MBT3892017.1 8-amino-7-oxononanoate synthase [Gammaproteobacteria bacterium]